MAILSSSSRPSPQWKPGPQAEQESGCSTASHSAPLPMHRGALPTLRLFGVKPGNCRCPPPHPLTPDTLSRSECQCISGRGIPRRERPRRERKTFTHGRQRDSPTLPRGSPPPSPAPALRGAPLTSRRAPSPRGASPQGLPPPPQPAALGSRKGKEPPGFCVK